MPRFVAVALLFVISSGLLTPLTAAAPESRQPACCRKYGAHRCGMTPPGGVSVRPSACPLYQVPALPAGTQFSSVASSRVFAVSLRTDSSALFSADSTVSKFEALRSKSRAPPAFLSAL